MADTVTAVAVAELINANDMVVAVEKMATTVMSAISDLQDFADGVLLAFYLVHFGAERLETAKRIRRPQAEGRLSGSIRMAAEGAEAF